MTTPTPTPTPTPCRQPTELNVDSTLPLRQSVTDLLRRGVGPEQIRVWVDEVLINEVDYPMGKKGEEEMEGVMEGEMEGEEDHSCEEY